MKNSIPRIALATFQLLSSHMWLVVDILESTDLEHFHHHRRSYGDSTTLEHTLYDYTYDYYYFRIEKFIA